MKPIQTMLCPTKPRSQTSAREPVDLTIETHAAGSGSNDYSIDTQIGGIISTNLPFRPLPQPPTTLLLAQRSPGDPLSPFPDFKLPSPLLSRTTLFTPAVSQTTLVASAPAPSPLHNHTSAPTPPPVAAQSQRPHRQRPRRGAFTLRLVRKPGNGTNGSSSFRRQPLTSSFSSPVVGNRIRAYNKHCYHAGSSRYRNQRHLDVPGRKPEYYHSHRSRRYAVRETPLWLRLSTSLTLESPKLGPTTAASSNDDFDLVFTSPPPRLHSSTSGTVAGTDEEEEGEEEAGQDMRRGDKRPSWGKRSHSFDEGMLLR